MDFVNDTTLVYVHVAYFSPLSVVSRTIILFGMRNSTRVPGSCAATKINRMVHSNMVNRSTEEDADQSERLWEGKDSRFQLPKHQHLRCQLQSFTRYEQNLGESSQNLIHVL